MLFRSWSLPLTAFSWLRAGPRESLSSKLSMGDGSQLGRSLGMCGPAASPVGDICYNVRLPCPIMTPASMLECAGLKNVCVRIDSFSYGWTDVPVYEMSPQGVRTPPPRRLARRVQRFPGRSALEECAVFERRKGELLKARLAMPYQLQKCATWRHFQSFLRRQPNRPTEDDCSGDQVVNYLISADSRGKTIVHSMECERQLSPPCSCPVRLAFKTVDSTIGRQAHRAQIGRAHV